MKSAVVAFGMMALFSACATDRGQSKGGYASDRHTTEARAHWEQIIPEGMAEEEFRQLIQEDSWASGWMKLPRTMSAAELSEWARKRGGFVGHIHREAAFQEAVGEADVFHVYSCQGIPSTDSQMTVVFAADDAGVWRVVYRAVRQRPCF